MAIPERTPVLRDTVDSSFVEALHLAFRSGAGMLALAAIAALILLRPKAKHADSSQPSELGAQTVAQV